MASGSEVPPGATDPVQPDKVPSDSKFGLLGGFEGDDATLQQATNLCQQLLSGANVPASEIAQVLETLPHAGRKAVVHTIMKCPTRDATLFQLFDWCFENPAEGQVFDQEILQVGCGDARYLNNKRAHVLRQLLLSISGKTPLCIEVFRRYCQTSSRIFYPRLLCRVARNPDFPDDELETAFIESAEVGRAALLETCRGLSHRRNFLGQLVAKGFVEPTLLPWASSEAVKEQLLSNPEILSKVGLQNWHLHSAVYLQYLREKLKDLVLDPIKLGATFRAFEDQIKSQISPADALSLLQICQEFHPVELAPKVSSEQEEYLKEISKAGTLTGEYDCMYFVLPKAWILGYLDCNVTLLQEALVVGSQGVSFREDQRPLCAKLLRLEYTSHTMFNSIVPLAVQCFTQFSVDEFWAVLKPKNPPVNSPEQMAFNAFRKFVGDFTALDQYNISWKLLDAWVAMHERCAPSASSLSTVTEEDWDLWTRQYISAFTTLLTNTFHKTLFSIGKYDPNQSRSRLTQAGGFFKELLRKYWAAFRTPGQQCSLWVMLQSLETVNLLVRSLWCDQNVSPGLRAELQSILEGVIIDDVLPRIDAALVFDPTSKQYIDAVCLDRITDWVKEQLYNDSFLAASSGVRAGVFSLMQTLVNRATLSEADEKRTFVESVVQKWGKTVKSFALYGIQVHKAAVKSGLDLIHSLFTACREATDDDLMRQIWTFYKSKVFSKDDLQLISSDGDLSSSSKKMRDSYLKLCQELLPSVLEDEVPLLLQVGHCAVKHGTFEEVYDSFHSLKLVRKVMDSITGISDAFRQLWTSKSEPISASDVWDYHDAQTKKSAADDRMKGYVALLEKAVADIPYLAKALSLVAKRIKNEAAVIRQKVYEWVENNIHDVVVSSITTGQTVDHVLQITKALVTMLKDNLSSSDSTDTDSFEQMWEQMAEALDYDWQYQQAQVRQQWIIGAIRLEWIASRAAGNAQKWHTFAWPIPKYRIMPDRGWITEQGFKDHILPALMSQCRRSDAAKVTSAFYSDPKTFNATNALQPQQAVTMLLTALAEVDKEFNGTSAVGPLQFSAKTIPSEAWRQVIRLYKYAGPRWTEVPWLKDFCQDLTVALGEPKSLTRDYCLDAKQLFSALVDMYRCDALWYEIPGLLQFCEALLLAIIHFEEDASTVAKWWWDGQLAKGAMDFSTLNETELQFVVSRFSALKPQNSTPPEYKAKVVLSAVSAAKRLLQITPSAIYLPFVFSTLAEHRDDLLDRFFGSQQEDLAGPFQPKGHDQLRLPVRLTWKQADGLGGRGIQLISRLALEDAKSSACSKEEQQGAVKAYVGASCTGYQEVIDLLQTLTEQLQEDPTDDSLNRFQKSILMAVPTMDTAWYVLSYLLSPAVIGAWPQSIMVDILSSFFFSSHVDKFVRVLAILLSPERRSVMNLSLHKTVVRLLASAGTAEAGKLLKAEWAQRHAEEAHPDLLREIVRVCVRGLEASIAEAAWQILEEVAADPDLPETVSGLLMVPKWDVSTPVKDFAVLSVFIEEMPAPKPSDDREVALVDLHASLRSQAEWQGMAKFTNQMEDDSDSDDDGPRPKSTSRSAPSTVQWPRQSNGWPRRVFRQVLKQLKAKSGKPRAPKGEKTPKTPKTTIRFAQDVLVQQLRLQPSFEITKQQTAFRLRQLLQTLSAKTTSESLRLLLDCQVHAFSPAVVGIQDDEAADGLRSLLLMSTDHQGMPEKFRAEQVALLYCNLQLRVLSNALETSQKFEDLCKSHPAALHFQQTLGRLLELLNETKGAQWEMGALWAKAATTIFNELQGRTDYDWIKHLVKVPLSRQLNLLSVTKSQIELLLKPVTTESTLEALQQ